MNVLFTSILPDSQETYNAYSPAWKELSFWQQTTLRDCAYKMLKLKGFTDPVCGFAIQNECYTWFRAYGHFKQSMIDELAWFYL